MRIFLIALLLLASATAQPGTLDDEGLRVAFGDNPSTTETEATGQWNFQELHILPNGTHQLDAPDYARQLSVICSECQFVRSGAGFSVTVTNETTVKLAYSAAGGVPFSAEANFDGRFILYAPTGTYLQSSLGLSKVGAAASDPSLELYFGDAAGSFWFTVSPLAPATVSKDSGFDFVALFIGLVAGLAIWAFLVQRGLVQKRKRKQVAGTAAHKEVAKVESAPTLEGRKRVLMAALKELELAKMNQEMDTAVYDALKADYKKQTVTVMRAIEESKVE